MITKEIKLLKDEFERIKGMGYVASSRGGSTGIGKTFEDLLGKKEDTSEEPDYLGIEIKTRRAYSYSYTTLFNACPANNNECELKRLVSTYGYPDRILYKCRVLNVSVYANTCTLVANRYLFKLFVSREEKRVYLGISDKNFKILEKKIYWDFDQLKEKLYHKLNYLAFIKAWPKVVDGVTYYKYYHMDFYKLKSFEDFLSLLEKGNVRITFKLGVYRTGDKLGEIHDRGTGFELKEENFEKLFYKLED